MRLLLSFVVLFLIACQQEKTTPPVPAPESRDTTTSSDDGSFEEQLADYENKERVFWQKPDLVIDKLGDLSDKTVADIGAGSGYFSRRLVQRAQKVIAIDIDQKFIQFMDSIKLVELSPEIQPRFETRLAPPDAPNLQPEEADIVLFVNTYIYLPDRAIYLRRVFEALSPGGKLVIIDFKKKRMPIKNPPVSIRLELFEVENEVEKAGYTLQPSDDTSLDFQYIVIASKPRE